MRYSSARLIAITLIVGTLICTQVSAQDSVKAPDKVNQQPSSNPNPSAADRKPAFAASPADSRVSASKLRAQPNLYVDLVLPGRMAGTYENWRAGADAMRFFADKFKDVADDHSVEQQLQKLEASVTSDLKAKPGQGALFQVVKYTAPEGMPDTTPVRVDFVGWGHTPEEAFKSQGAQIGPQDPPGLLRDTFGGYRYWGTLENGKLTFRPLYQLPGSDSFSSPGNVRSEQEDEFTRRKAAALSQQQHVDALKTEMATRAAAQANARTEAQQRMGREKDEVAARQAEYDAQIKATREKEAAAEKERQEAAEKQQQEDADRRQRDLDVERQQLQDQKQRDANEAVQHQEAEQKQLDEQRKIDEQEQQERQKEVDQRQKEADDAKKEQDDLDDILKHPPEVSGSPLGLTAPGMDDGKPLPPNIAPVANTAFGRMQSTLSTMNAAGSVQFVHPQSGQILNVNISSLALGARR